MFSIMFTRGASLCFDEKWRRNRIELRNSHVNTSRGQGSLLQLVQTTFPTPKGERRRPHAYNWTPITANTEAHQLTFNKIRQKTPNMSSFVFKWKPREQNKTDTSAHSLFR